VLLALVIGANDLMFCAESCLVKDIRFLYQEYECHCSDPLWTMAEYDVLVCEELQLELDEAMHKILNEGLAENVRNGVYSYLDARNMEP
jgi:hypothetical protein